MRETTTSPFWYLLSFSVSLVSEEFGLNGKALVCVISAEIVVVSFIFVVCSKQWRKCGNLESNFLNFGPQVENQKIG
ncbi:hypothetical protein IV203_005630 [Nitzschia inconspicua]|uniref:Transmembrane protein n=1 Tax=Nitzschia inconspicua TaxID=303405 RepID=A0A9K3KMQ1_9STRA|nr:hypothetical protein IV203_005630 [Nitzschia inconspicua]